ncbi:MAG: tetratricopeptide repeat protein, partial [Candidatus Wallbacteria bacterium]|nr:tetratricopeptide repeat protein [Candidatus Wallbacteria bacterium]
MIYLFKLIDLFFGTSTYFSLRIDEIAFLAGGKRFDLAEKALFQLEEDAAFLRYRKELHAEIFFFLAELYYMWGKPHLALDFCLKSREIVPRIEFTFRAGWIQFHAFKELDKSREYFLSCLNSQPGFHPALFALGEVELQLHNLDAAEKYFRLALDQKKDPAVFLHLGQILLNKENFSDALDALKSALKLSPESAEINYFLGCAFLREADHTQALYHFRQATFFDNSYTLAYYEIARIYHLILGETDKAIIAYNKILEFKPESDEALFNLALIFSRLKRNTAKAMQLLFRLLKYHPRHQQAISLLCDIYTGTWNYGLALKYLEQLEPAPENQLRMADLLFKLCSWTRAEEIYIDLYQKGFTEVENKIKKIALFPGNSVCT